MVFVKLFVNQKYSFYYANKTKSAMHNDFYYCPSPVINLHGFWKFLYRLCNSPRFKWLSPFFGWLWLKKAVTRDAYRVMKKERKFCVVSSGLRWHFFLFEALKSLKKKFPKALMVFIFEDKVSYYMENPAFNLKKMRAFFDLIYSYNQLDVSCYGLRRLDPFVCDDYSDVDASKLQKTDLFFIGQSKGRTDDIIKIFEHCKQVGLICDFYINNVPLEKQKYKDKITYNKILPYEEVLKHAKAAKCIVNIIQEGAVGITLRECEAIGMNKFLLTNNKAIYDCPYYSPYKVIDYYSMAEQISKLCEEPKEKTWNVTSGSSILDYYKRIERDLEVN